MVRDDAVDEENIALCCALGCINCGLYKDVDCMGCSGKMGLCCLNVQMCCKPSAPCLPCGCCGPRFENDGCSIFNIQCQLCNAVITGAIPCNKEGKFSFLLILCISNNNLFLILVAPTPHLPCYYSPRSLHGCWSHHLPQVRLLCQDW